MPQVPSTHAEFIAGVRAFTAMCMSIMAFIIRCAPIALLARLELPARLQQALPYPAPR
jgi:branched-subunit amino acid transport protein